MCSRGMTASTRSVRNGAGLVRVQCEACMLRTPTYGLRTTPNYEQAVNRSSFHLVGRSQSRDDTRPVINEFQFASSWLGARLNRYKKTQNPPALRFQFCLNFGILPRRHIVYIIYYIVSYLPLRCGESFSSQSGCDAGKP
jgi:hypothetical protein